MPESIIRLLPMSKNDLDEVVEIEATSHVSPWGFASFISSLEAGHLAYCLRELTDGQKDPLISYCVLMSVVDELHLLNITVHPAYRRQGYAKKMLVAIETAAKQRQIDKIYLEVRQSNQPAIQLYQSLGYKMIALRENYYPNEDGTREDAQVMVKQIDKE